VSKASFKARGHESSAQPSQPTIGGYSKGRVPAYCQHYQWSIERGAGVAPSGFEETSAGRQSFDMCYHHQPGILASLFRNRVQGLKSESLQKFEGELTVSLAYLKGLKAPPVYVRRAVWVCLHCGFAEHSFPLKSCNQSKRG
jgi:hypothetical protein